MSVSAQSPLEQMAADHQGRNGTARVRRRWRLHGLLCAVPSGLDLAVLETAMIAATLALLAGVLL
jgi:hypothetical protein